MLEKIGHIKNPLTVIAMFAGIAEVSGAIALPFLTMAVQETYVWFLMVFPCLIVLLFFATLWKDYTVLYAPTDYPNANSFKEVFDARRSKNKQLDYYASHELKSEFIAEFSKDAVGEQSGVQPEEGITEATAICESPEEPENNSPEQRPNHSKEIASIQAQVVENFIRFGDYKREVAKQLQDRLLAPYKLSESPRTMPNALFDVVLSADDATWVGNILFVTNKNLRAQADAAKEWIRIVSMYRETLDPVDALKLRCLVCIVYKKTNMTQDQLYVLEGQIQDMALQFPFTVYTHRFELEDLVERSFPGLLS